MCAVTYMHGRVIFVTWITKSMWNVHKDGEAKQRFSE